MQILHCFADEGIESEALSAYGSVTRVGWNATDNPYTDRLIVADVREWEPNRTFDLGLFHPPCQKWTPGAQMNGTTENHENHIPLSRDLAKRCCDNWIIENVPQSPLNNPVYLDGRMFGSPLKYERAFETNYHVPQPPRQKTFAPVDERIKRHHQTGGFTGSKSMWKSLKGYTGDYNSRSLKREAIPRAYINYLVRPLLAQTA